MKLFKKILLQEKEVTFHIERTIKCPPSRLKLICNKGYCNTNPEDSGPQVPTGSFKRSGIIILLDLSTGTVKARRQWKNASNILRKTSFPNWNYTHSRTINQALEYNKVFWQARFQKFTSFVSFLRMGS